MELPPDHPDWEPMSADMEYALALGRAVSELVNDELESQGFDVENTDLNYSGQTSCPGADW
ncbi:hypothetical protein [Occultella kanbiaonis]|uniref:hypothetical protein n=1 Tax=Occultella kanbiaonis TaxID=2675754 RepID=UPI0013D739A6|nr:hypothetical protein [Occultella kanbiaonis]